MSETRPPKAGRPALRGSLHRRRERPLLIMFYTYILQSLKDNRTYVGHADNLERRLKEHNAGRVNATKYRVPFKFLFYEQFNTVKEAKKNENCTTNREQAEEN